MSELTQQNTEISDTLLPCNATSFEKTVEQAIKYDVSTNILSGFKFQTMGANINLALSWEYSLAQINIDDFRERVIQGLQFHRLKGTPYSLRQALSWYGLTGIIIEEEPAGERFANFQIGFDELPDVLDVDTIIEVAKLAAPLRSNLARMYNKDYDVRPFILDKSSWGDMLSDYSGIRLSSNGPKLSFRRKMFCHAQMPSYSTQSAFKEELRVTAKLEDGFKLGLGVLDKTKLSRPTHKNFYEEKLTTTNTNRICNLPDELIELRPICPSMPTLSSSLKLDDFQTCFAGFYEKKNDKPFTLSFSKLSVRTNESEIVPINVRYIAKVFADAQYDSTNIKVSTGNTVESASFDTKIEPKASIAMKETTMMTGKYKGKNTWTDHIHFDVPWSEQHWYGKMTEE